MSANEATELITRAEIVELTRKVDKSFAASSRVEGSVGILTARFDAFIEGEEQRHEVRGLTCPTAPTVRGLVNDVGDLKSDITAVVGIQRAQGKDIGSLKEWKVEVEKRHESENQVRWWGKEALRDVLKWVIVFMLGAIASPLLSKLATAAGGN